MHGGGTRYIPALEQARKICDASEKSCDKFVMYFMSDGMPHDCPNSEVKKLQNKPYFSKIKFYGCGFGHSYYKSFEKLKNLVN